MSYEYFCITELDRRPEDGKKTTSGFRFVYEYWCLVLSANQKVCKYSTENLTSCEIEYVEKREQINDSRLG